MHAVTQLGTHFAIGSAAGITALAMWRKGRREDAWTVIVSTGGAMAINTILKNIFQRQRPIERARRIKLPGSHSFPSGHSLLSAATYPIVAHHFVQNRSFATQAVVHTLTGMTILSVGFSRVYFGVHFPSDVFGGFAAGFGWLGLASLSHSLRDQGRGMREGIDEGNERRTMNRRLSIFDPSLFHGSVRRIIAGSHSLGIRYVIRHADLRRQHRIHRRALRALPRQSRLGERELARVLSGLRAALRGRVRRGDRGTTGNGCGISSVSGAASAFHIAPLATRGAARSIEEQPAPVPAPSPPPYLGRPVPLKKRSRRNLETMSYRVMPTMFVE